MLEATAQQMLSRGDPVGAVTALTRAAELSPSDADRSRRLTKAAFVGVNMAGRLGDSEEIVAEALEAEPGPGASPQADVTAAFVLLNGDGDLETVHRLLVRAIEAQGDELDATDEDVAAAVYLLLLVCGFAGRADLWASYFAILDRLRPGVPEDLLLASRTMPDPVRDAVRCSIASTRSSRSSTTSPTRGTFARSRWPRCSSTAWADAGRPSGAW